MLALNNNMITPASLVNITKNYNFSSDGRKLGTVYTIVLSNSLVAWRGSPNSSGVFTQVGQADLPDEIIPANSRLGAISRKIEAIRSLFSQDGQLFSFQSWDNTSPPVSCYVRLKSINFPEGPWYDKVDYTITLETDSFLSGPYSNDHDYAYTDKISSANEDWQLSPSEIPYSYSLQHTLSAVGQTVYISGVQPQQSWQYAKDFVLNQLNLGYSASGGFSSLAGTSIFASSVLTGGSVNIATLNNYNYARTEAVNELDGSYSVTENWVMASGAARETWSGTLSISPFGGEATQTVNLQGKVEGLYVNLNDYASRFGNAENYFVNYVQGQYAARAALISSGVTVNPNPTIVSIDNDVVDGTISWSASFDNRLLGPSGTSLNYRITKNQSLEDYVTEVRVDGTVSGRGTLDLNSRYANANWAYSQLVSSGTFFTWASGYSNIVDLQTIPLSQGLTPDPSQGQIEFSLAYNNRLFPNVTEQYEVNKQYSREDGVTTVTVNGTVIGLATNIYNNGPGSGSLNTKFANASGFFTNNTTPLIPIRAALYGSSLVQTGVALTQSVGTNVNAGSINYNFSYNSIPLPLFSGALFEQITLSYGGGGTIFASIPIPGRTQGPILQPMGTISSKTAQLSIELVMGIPNGSTYAARAAQKPDPTFIINQLAPTGTLVGDPSESWNLQTGRYSYNVPYTFIT